MKKKVILCVQGYRPDYEAISKEVKTLADYLKSQGWSVMVHDLHVGNLFTCTFSSELISYHMAWYPLLMPFFYLYSCLYPLRHIYTSLADRPYLSLPLQSPIILTAAAPCSPTAMQQARKRILKISSLVLENEIQTTTLSSNLQAKSMVIYPGINLGQFWHQPPVQKDFTILFASNPKSTKKFAGRGIYLLLDTAQKTKPGVIFDFAWRSPNHVLVTQLIKKNKITNIRLTHTLIKDMNLRYGQAHCTIIPYTDSQDTVKLMPHSAIESLAAGKPVLCSSQSGIASLIEKHQVGVVFEPNVPSLLMAITKIRKNYAHYQKNCQPVAKRLFSHERFAREYEALYTALINTKSQ